MILVVGGVGFFGWHLGHRLASCGEPCLLASRREAEPPAFIRPFAGDLIRTAVCDMADWPRLDGLAEAHRVTGIVHAANWHARAGRPDVWPYEHTRSNALGTLNVLRLAQSRGLPLTFLSSATVYEGSPGPWREDLALPVPSANTTGATKRALEEIAQLFRMVGVRVRVVRPPRIYGPLYTSGLNPMYAMIRAAAEGRHVELPQVDAAAGGDFSYTADCARAVHMIHAAPELPHHTYNVGGGRWTTYGEAAGVLSRLAGIEIRLGSGTGGPERAPERSAFVAMERIEQDLGFHPAFDLEAGLTAWLQAEAGALGQPRA